MKIIPAIIKCLFKRHTWLSSGHNRRRCSRCNTKQKRGPETKYVWVNDREV